mmetsp:Transcript_7992/g.10497  ORF Transcript_7992/g.10497 Transcript_7992/m.10497 type:complete len:189 (+) Transcript_7992:289-855(+)|eukprot:CAMPEP_0198145704 /NCGR_PEP_ID=MMETSP1443-20131203/24854_1 /TAXON_ID=186043 /ORGANISM="Entomoneis sp., Strain CCMP2396" /LENGTH=188 /DNA_ID=CAMNT_0043809407 /DNA_START=228 /DNA_END=794 /DNA_ORIENTATION=-
MESSIPGIRFVDYVDESQLHQVMDLVGRDLSEPYSIFTYRYFLYRFPQLCILAVPEGSDEPIGCVVGKMDREQDGAGPIVESNGQEEDQGNEATLGDQQHSTGEWTGYIGMLAVRENYRRKGIGKALVNLVLQRMKKLDCTSATLETEVTNRTAQKLYQECFGFVREEMLVRYYLNWNDAYRLRLWFS